MGSRSGLLHGDAQNHWLNFRPSSSLEGVGFFFFFLVEVGRKGMVDFSGSCLLLEVDRREEDMRGRIQKVAKVVL